MHRGFRSSLLTLALVAVLSAAFSNAAGAAAPATRQYVALGDSLAFGFGASDPARAYVPLLFQYFQQPRTENVRILQNLSRPGETSDSFIAGGQLALAVAAIVETTTDTRVVTLDIGGNDLLVLTSIEPCQSFPGSDLCQALVAAQLRKFAINYDLILGALSSALENDPGNKETLFVMTYYNPYSGTGLLYEAFADRALLGSDLVIDCSAPPGDARAGLNDLIACIGASSGAVVADVYPAFRGRGFELTHIAAGDIHPNDAGYAVIAQTFIAAD
jgi:lysophospholipase L1-like esterase